MKVDRADPRVRTAMGNWDAFDLPMEVIERSAEQWRVALAGAEKPWLCWNVSDRWCSLQQKLVQHAGWTPVLGFDPRAGRPTPLPGSIVIDFNAGLELPILTPMFVLEFVHLFAGRLAFWHSDLLCRLPTMEYIAGVFNSLRDGEMASVPLTGGFRHLFRRKSHRYWDLLGCTTRGASRHQFECGTGWWRHFERHPNGRSDKKNGYYWDYGVGIMYWKRHCKGRVHDIPLSRIEEGHCTSINYREYVRVSGAKQANPTAELDMNYDLEAVAERLGINDLL